MKNNKKKSSTAKKLMPAFAMLTVSAMTLASSTYAWFSMNTQVTAKGMQLTAQAEGGLIISNAVSGGEWKADAMATTVAGTALIPTSTANTSTWYHNKSNEANNAKAHQASNTYTNCNSTSGVVDTTGIGIWTDSEGATHNIYLLNNFYIKSSGEAISSNLTINSISVTGTTESGTALDRSLRVAITIDGNAYIFAPVAGGDTSYYVGGSDSAITINGSSATNISTSRTSIPATSAAPINAKIYCYFEGEDEDCKSSNITTTMDNLTVEVTFGTATPAQQGSGS
jgi:hypothetical protein